MSTTIYNTVQPEATITGNMLTIHKLTFEHVQMLVEGRKIEQLSVRKTGGTDDHPLYDLSYAMSALEHKTYAGLIHRYNAEQRAKNPHLNPKGDGPKGGPDGTPPQGGTPGVAKTVEFSETIAIAA